MPLRLNYNSVDDKLRPEFREIQRFTEELEGLILAINRQGDDVDLRMRQLAGKFPKNALSQGLVREGHIHNPFGAAKLGLGGIYHADYVIDPGYVGTAGASIVTATGAIAKAYATIVLAVADAIANRSGSGTSTTFYLVGGTHVVSSALTFTPPTAGSWVFIGEGMDRTIVSCTQGSGTAITCSNISAGGRYVASGFKIMTTQPIKIWDCGSGNESYFHLVHFNPGNSSAVGLDPGVQSNTLGTFTSQCVYSGTGTGVGGSAGPVATGSLYSSDDFFQSAIGISLGSTSGVVNVSGGRASCSTVFIDVPSSTTLLVGLSGVAINGPGFRITGSGTIMGALTINGCQFQLSSSQVGIDFSQTTGTGSVNVNAVSITGNTFYGGGSTIGVKGHATSGPATASVIGNSFTGFTAGNELVKMHKNAASANFTRIFGNSSDAGEDCPDFYDMHPEEILISTGNITPSRPAVILNAEIGSADTVSTINTNNMQIGSWGYLFPGSGMEITLDGGNYWLPGGVTVTLRETQNEWAIWFFDSSKVWVFPLVAPLTTPERERAFALGVAGSIPGTTAQFADFPVILPHAGTLARMKAAVKVAVTANKTIQLRKATLAGGYTDWADVSGFVLTLSAGTNGGYYRDVLPGAEVTASEGDIFQLSTTDATASGTNLVVEVVYRPA